MDARELGKRRGYKQVVVLGIDEMDVITVCSWGRDEELDEEIGVICDEIFYIARRKYGHGGEK